MLRRPSRGSLLLVAIPLFFLGCSGAKGGNIVGGACSYTETPGEATVVSLNNATAGQNDCNNDPVEVVFNFTPSDPLKANAATDKNVHLTVGDGKNPSRSYIASKGFAVGATLKCSRKTIISGTCTPIVFDFPDLDLSDSANSKTFCN